MWTFHQVPENYWHSLSHQIYFFDWLSKKLNISNYKQWYSNATRKNIKSHGGGGLLNKIYHDSPVTALLAVYPKCPWKVWKFKQVPKGEFFNVVT